MQNGSTKKRTEKKQPGDRKKRKAEDRLALKEVG